MYSRFKTPTEEDERRAVAELPLISDIAEDRGILFLASVLGVAVGPAFLFSWWFKLMGQYETLTWSFGSIFWMAYYVAVGSAMTVLFVGAVGYLGCALFYVVGCMAGTPAGRRAFLAAASGLGGAWLAGALYLRFGSLAGAGAVIAAAFLLAWWSFQGMERRIEKRFTGYVRWFTGSVSVVYLIGFLAAIQLVVFLHRGAPFWELPETQTAPAAAAQEDPQPSEPASRGRIALVIPKRVVDREFYVYLDRRILARREYGTGTVIHRSDSGTYLYDSDGNSAGKRKGGRFVFLPEPEKTPEAGLVYSPADPRMGNTDLFEILFVELEPGEHRVEFVSFVPEYDRARSSPFVVWSTHDVSVSEGETVEVEGFRGIDSVYSKLPSSVRAAAPWRGGEMSVDEKIARRRRGVRAFERLLREHPLIVAFEREARRMKNEDHWMFRFPEEFGGEREYNHNQINAMSTWLLRMMESERDQIR